jgi:hypothetical protein
MSTSVKAFQEILKNVALHKLIKFCTCWLLLKFLCRNLKQKAVMSLLVKNSKK